MRKCQVLMAVLATCLPATNANAESKAPMYPELSSYIADRLAEFPDIPAERRELLEELATFIQRTRVEGKPSRLTFICTHNSRRSQLSQIWAATAAAHYGLSGIEAFSGGTEATAFNPRTVSALQRAGFRVDRGKDIANSVHECYWHDHSEPLRCFSKVVLDAPNPHSDFAAVMTCSQADRACPHVPEAAFRIAIPYVDPKASDGTKEEAATYDERCREIAREMLYALSKVAERE